MNYAINYKRAHNSWKCMWSRCTNPKDKDYKNYGARGISVTDSWKDFSQFVADMGFPGTDTHTEKRLILDRIDNSKGYSKDNCRWATRKEQNSNRRKPNKKSEPNKVEEVTEIYDPSADFIFVKKHYGNFLLRGG